MKKQIIIILCTIILGIFIGIGLYLIKGKEKNIFIQDVNFTLNDIKNRFLASPYSEENNCKANIKNNSILVKCKGEKYYFNLKESNLILNISENKDKEIFKYMVDSIQTFYGSKYEEYYNTMDKFLSKELSITNLYYNIDGNKAILKVNLLKKLEIYKEKEEIKKETIVDRTKTKYIFNNDNLKIDNIEFIYDEELNWIIFAGVLYGNKNTSLNLKLYNEYEQLLYSVEEDLNKYKSGTSVNLSFVINLELEKLNLNNENIKKYSISLK